MDVEILKQYRWQRLSELVEHRLGLDFASQRLVDLYRATAKVAEDLGYPDADSCAERLVAEPLTQARLQALANRLTIGETYFFRDQGMFDALAGSVLPGLIQARGRDKRLRIWSAACCTGEEPYSLAILLHRLLPNLRDWDISILATDINVHFLARARAGLFGEWSFRQTPDYLKSLYFRKVTERRYEIVPEIRRLVTFEAGNLAGDAPFSASLSTLADLIVCRNALIYFSNAQSVKAMEQLCRVLQEDGWLIPGPGEGLYKVPSQMVAVNFPGATFYRKTNAAVDARLDAGEPHSGFNDLQGEPILESSERLPVMEMAASPILPDEPSTVVSPNRPGVAAGLERARSLADQGQLMDALTECDTWIKANKLDPAGYYFHGLIAQELGDSAAARRSLGHAIYLEPDFVLGHWAMGSIWRSVGRHGESEKSYTTALRLLHKYSPDEILPRSERLKASELKEILTSLIGSSTPTGHAR